MAYSIQEFKREIAIPDQYESIFGEILGQLYRGEFSEAHRLVGKYYLPSHPTFDLLLKAIQVKTGSHDQKSADALSNLNSVDYYQYVLGQCLELEEEAIFQNDQEAIATIRQLLYHQALDIKRTMWIEVMGDETNMVEGFWINLILKFQILFPDIETEKTVMIDELTSLGKRLEVAENWVDYIVVLRNLGNQAYVVGDTQTALSSYEIALNVAKRINLIVEIFGLLNNLGVLYRIRGNYDQALAYYMEALGLTEKHHMVSKQGMVKNNIGAIYFYKSELNTATAYYLEAYDNYKIDGTPKQIASVLDNLGEVYYHQGNYQKALHYLEDGMSIRRQLGLPQDIATSLDNIGNIHRDRGNLEVATDAYTQALSHRKKLNNPKLLAMSYQNLGHIHMMRGQLDDARSELLKIPQIWREEGNNHELIRAWFDLLKLSLEQNDDLDFSTYFGEITSVYHSIEDSGKIAIDPIRHIFIISSALALKISGRQKQKFFALQDFQSIVQDIDYDFNLQYFVYLQILELLIFELNVFHEESTKAELKGILKSLKSSAQDQHAMPKLFKIGLLEAELALLDLDIEKAEEILIQYSLNTEEYGLIQLNRQINHFYVDFLARKDSLLSQKRQKTSLQDILKRSSIGETVEKLSRLSQPDYLPEEPAYPQAFFIIHLESGNSIYSRTFNQDFKVNEGLVGSLISAMNSFLQETFATDSGLNRLDYGGNTVLFNHSAEAIFCYVISGSVEFGILELLQIKEKIRNQPELWNDIMNFRYRIERTSTKTLDEILKSFDKL